MLLECLTHRLRGHYEGDPAGYRAAITADEWQQKDPILRLQRRALAAGWIDEADAAAIEREAAAASRRPSGSRARARSRRPSWRRG
jgi:pyruvate dehydrogenase E1 component alpha subunit